MKTRTLLPLVALSLACAPREEEVPPAATATQDTAPAAAPAASEWAAATMLPPGAQMMVVSGNPAEAGDFTIRLRFPADYRVPPHSHPSAENVTVVSGLGHFGMGRTLDMAAPGVRELGPGQSIDLPANDPHWAHAASETVLEIRSTGPFQINYVNPADDPRTGS